MAYTPTQWETGDIITAEKLNNMEQGIEDAFVAPAVTIADEGAVLTVNSSGEWDTAYPEKEVAEISVDVTIDQTTVIPQSVEHAAGDIDKIITAKICVLHMTLYAQQDTEFTTPLNKYDIYRRSLPVGSSDTVSFDGVMLLQTSPAVIIAYGQIFYNTVLEQWTASPFRLLTVQ